MTLNWSSGLNLIVCVIVDYLFRGGPSGPILMGLCHGAHSSAF